MSIEVLPLGYRCNMACPYCYQEPIRLAGEAGGKVYDLQAMMDTLKQEGYKFSIFGGEPLMVPLDDLKVLWQFGLDVMGPKVKATGRGERVNSIQTNGTLITDAHLQAFKDYDVGVGMSLDGPGELNDARWMGSVERTREATATSIGWFERLLADKQHPSLIVTLHRLNATAERRPALVAWLRDLAGKGLTSVNLHLLEVDSTATRDTLAIAPTDLAKTILAVGALQADTNLRVAPLQDMLHLLLGEDRWSPNGEMAKRLLGQPYDQAQARFLNSTNCTWNACDPYTTDAVHGVDGQGGRHNCGRTAKEGIPWEKAGKVGRERHLALFFTPQKFGGCQGCRFFYGCKGHCPGESDRGDWRGKTEHCSTLMELFETLEADLVRQGRTPFSLLPERPLIELQMVDAWKRGQNLSVTDARVALKQQQAGKAAAKPAQAHPGDQPHGDLPHGDIPHGDHTDAHQPVQTHGDHTDVGKDAIAWNALG